MTVRKIIYIIAFIIVLPEVSLGQHFFRMKADCTIKEKFDGDKSSLTIGKVYYDKNVQKIVYVNKFPENETWVIKDSMFVKLADGKFKSSNLLPFNPQFSIFHMSLNGSLKNYGLDDTNFKIESVEKEEGMVITTWRANATNMGKVVVSQKDKKLFGVAFFNSKDELMGKQFFKKYETTRGFEFPGEIVEIYYTEKGESYKITTYKNITVDDPGEDNIYDCYIPAAK